MVSVLFYSDVEWCYRESLHVLEIARLEVSPAITYVTWVVYELRSDAQNLGVPFKICECDRVEDTFASCYLKAFYLSPSVHAVVAVGELYSKLTSVGKSDAFHGLRAVARQTAISIVTVKREECESFAYLLLLGRVDVVLLVALHEVIGHRYSTVRNCVCGLMLSLAQKSEIWSLRIWLVAVWRKFYHIKRKFCLGIVPTLSPMAYQSAHAVAELVVLADI